MAAANSSPAPKPKSWPLPSDLLSATAVVPEATDPPVSKAPAAKAVPVQEDTAQPTMTSPSAKSKSPAVPREHHGKASAARRTSEAPVLPRQPGQGRPQVTMRFLQEERQKVEHAIAEAWKVKSNYQVDFESSMVTLAGAQSAGKTSFVERYLGYGFSVVKTGTATKRPSVLTVLPLEDGMNEDVIRVVEDFPNGGKSEQLEFKGTKAREKLHEWSAEKHNIDMPVRDCLHITIYSKTCKTPKRIMDLPGFLLNPDPDSHKDFDKIIMGMIVHAVSKPHSIVVCLADSNTEPANDQMIQVFRKNLAMLGDLSRLNDRLLLVLTKSDVWFHAVGRPEEVRKRLNSWKKNFFECTPMLMGSTLDPKVNTNNLDERNSQYETANAREKQSVEAFRRDVMAPEMAEDTHYWNSFVGFEKVSGAVLDKSLAMDMTLVQGICEKMQSKSKEVKELLKRLEQEIKGNNPEEHKRNCQKLVTALLEDTIKSFTSVPGASAEIHLSDSNFLQEKSRTLEEEEQDFLASRDEFSSEALEEAWINSSMRSIDYSRADEHAPAGFDEFYFEKRQDATFIKNVHQSQEKLMASAATHRAMAFFEDLAMDFMHFDEHDKARIHNAYFMDTDRPFMEDLLRRVHTVVKIRAITMREISLYACQKIAYLMVESFSYAWFSKLKNRDHRRIIESLAGSFGTDRVFHAARRGFLKQILIHAQHAFVSSANDHMLLMHHTGAFRHWDHNMKTQGAEAVAKGCNGTMNEARLNAVKHALPAKFMEDYTEAFAGISEALKIIATTGWHDALPLFLRSSVDKMIERNLLQPETQPKKPNPQSGEGEYWERPGITSCLHRMDPNNTNRMFGMVAVVYAWVAPEFAKQVKMRCLSGLMASPNSSIYKYDYQDSMCKELIETFLNEEDLAARSSALKHREAALTEEAHDLDMALKKLRDLLRS